MFGLLSVGDRFPFSRFADLHSRFEQAVNFMDGKQIVSLVSPSVGAGPFRIVLNLAELISVQMLEYRAGCVILNDCLGLQVVDEQVYHSEYSIPSGRTTAVQSGIKQLKEALLKENPDSSLAFLISGKALRLTSDFDKELAKQFQQAYDLLIKGDFDKAVKGFKGRGNGLTPAGDDFNAGLLMGLSVRQQTEKKELSKIRASIYTHSLGKELPVNTFLLQAYNGWYNEDWKSLLTALAEGQAAISNTFKQVLKQGETSGADTLTGFLAAWSIKI